MNTKRATLWVLLIIALGALIFFMYKFGGESGTTENGPLTSVPEVRATDPVKGNENGKVTIIEYADFQCPACAMYAPIMNELQKQQGEKFRLVYRYFPLTSIHRNALISSQAGEAARLQGKFWEMYDLLFINQNLWSESTNAESIMVDLAKQAGLDENRFKEDLNSASVKQAVQNGLNEATRLGLNSTPTFFINGKKLESNPRSLDDFKKIIDEAGK